jgi:hypothetical protein
MQQHVMNRLDARGHGPIAQWSDDAASRSAAASAFAAHQAMGYTMYDISERALTPGEVLGRKLEAFDAEATEILAVPRMVAG